MSTHSLSRERTHTIYTRESSIYIL